MSILNRPFNLEHAAQGAPYGRRDGRPIRIICSNMKNYEPSSGPLLTLVTSKTGIGNSVREYEVIQGYQLNGKIHGVRLDNGTDLVMLPMFTVDDENVFVGDTFERCTNKKSWTTFKVTPDWKPDPTHQYRLTTLHF